MQKEGAGRFTQSRKCERASDRGGQRGVSAADKPTLTDGRARRTRPRRAFESLGCVGAGQDTYLVLSLRREWEWECVWVVLGQVIAVLVGGYGTEESRIVATRRVTHLFTVFPKAVSMSRPRRVEKEAASAGFHRATTHQAGGGTWVALGGGLGGTGRSLARGRGAL